MDNETLFELINYGMYVLYGIVLFLIIKFLIASVLKQHHSNWNTLIDGFDFSTQEFYELLKEELQKQGITNVTIKPVSHKEGSYFSSKRSYLRIKWKAYHYDICAAPFGNGFFISWWLLYKNSLGQIIISKIPFVGRFLAKQWYPVTYYKIDTASMFMSYAQSSVLKVIDDITNDKGVRALTENERKPILNNIFVR